MQAFWNAANASAGGANSTALSTRVFGRGLTQLASEDDLAEDAFFTLSDSMLRRNDSAKSEDGGAGENKLPANIR